MHSIYVLAIFLYFDLFQHQNTSRRKSDFIKGFDFVVSNVRDRTDLKVMVMQAAFWEMSRKRSKSLVLRPPSRKTARKA